QARREARLKPTGWAGPVWCPPAQAGGKRGAGRKTQALLGHTRIGDVTVVPKARCFVHTSGGTLTDCAATRRSVFLAKRIDYLDGRPVVAITVSMINMKGGVGKTTLTF